MGKDARKGQAARTSRGHPYKEAGGASAAAPAADAPGELPERLSKKIMREARAQRKEVEAEEQRSELLFGVRDPAKKKKEEDAEMEFDEFEDSDVDEHEADYIADVQLDPEEESALEMFMDVEKAKRGERRLADVIAEKIREHEEAAAAASAEGRQPTLDPRVADIYKRVAVLLKDYTCGKLPKAFKVLPALNNWEELVYLTRPDEWSPHAMRAAVKLFSSGLNNKMSQRFYNVILLPYTREALRTQRKLNFSLYFALKKALYKPTAFYKGFLLPLCESGTCTLREATIVSSVLAKVSVPMLHSAACIVKLAQMPYSGANSLFLRVLLDKKYSLPYMVIDAVSKHFEQFTSDPRRMVVLWHQCLLVFVQRYKNDLTAEQRDIIRALVRKHVHPVISGQVCFELDNSTCRGKK